MCWLSEEFAGKAHCLPRESVDQCSATKQAGPSLGRAGNQCNDRVNLPAEWPVFENNFQAGKRVLRPILRRYAMHNPARGRGCSPGTYNAPERVEIPRIRSVVARD